MYLEHNHIKRNTLYQIAILLERLCHWSHPIMLFELFGYSLVDLEIKLTGRHCNLVHISMWFDDRYKLNVWKTREYKYFKRTG